MRKSKQILFYIFYAIIILSIFVSILELMIEGKDLIPSGSSIETTRFLGSVLAGHIIMLVFFIGGVVLGLYSLLKNKNIGFTYFAISILIIGYCLNMIIASFGSIDYANSILTSAGMSLEVTTDIVLPIILGFIGVGVGITTIIFYNKHKVVRNVCYFIALAIFVFFWLWEAQIDSQSTSTNALADIVSSLTTMGSIIALIASLLPNNSNKVIEDNNEDDAKSLLDAGYISQEEYDAITKEKTPSSIEGRLESLKHLHDSSLISDTEYEEKKKEILSNL